MKLKPFDVYIMYTALTAHFKGKYDYIKYKGKLNIPHETFLVRKDKFIFVKLSRMYNEDEIFDFMIANFVTEYPRTFWSGELLTDVAKDRYLEQQKKIQSLSYTFKNDLDNLFREFQNDPNRVFKVVNDQLPPIMMCYLRKEVSLETLVILNAYTDFVSHVTKKLGNSDFLWVSTASLIEKYQPFLRFDKEKTKKILKEKINELIQTSGDSN